MRRAAVLVRQLAGALALAALLAAPVHAQGADDAPAPAPPAAPTTPLTVAVARALPPDGPPVTVAGRVAVPSSVLQARALEIAIADSTGGIRVFSRALRPRLAEGDSVEVTGVLRLYRGDIELVASGIRVVPVPRRAVIPLSIALSPQSARIHAGQLVHLVGRVEAHGSSEGGHWLRLGPVQPGDSATLNLWVSGNAVAPADLGQFEEGEIVDAVGLVMAYRDNADDPMVWQVVPRGPDDVRVRGISHLWYVRGGLLLAGLLALFLVATVTMRLSARRHARAAAETEERYRQLLALLPDAVLVYAEDRILFGNRAAARLLRIEDERALVGRPVHEFLAPTSRDLARPAPLSTPVDENGVARLRGQLVAGDGETLDVEVASSRCRYHDQDAVVMLARDIGGQLRFERDLHALALRDELTALHNRRGFTLLAEQELARARRYGRSAYLLFADMNGLKAINDEYGHSAGDEALQLMARALRSVVRESDVVARWGGDEFVALMFETEEPGAESIGERLNDALRRLAADSVPFGVTASIGVTPLDPAAVNDISAAIERADVDLYRRRHRIRTFPRGLSGGE